MIEVIANLCLYFVSSLQLSPVQVFLPSDDQDISIQMRGGPEANMVTGWAQILALEPGYR